MAWSRWYPEQNHNQPAQFIVCKSTVETESVERPPVFVVRMPSDVWLSSLPFLPDVVRLVSVRCRRVIPRCSSFVCASPVTDLARCQPNTIITAIHCFYFSYFFFSPPPFFFFCCSGLLSVNTIFQDGLFGEQSNLAVW